MWIFAAGGNRKGFDVRQPLRCLNTEKHQAIRISGDGGLVLGENDHAAADGGLAVLRWDISDAALAKREAHDFAGAEQAQVVDGQVGLKEAVDLGKIGEHEFDLIEGKILGMRARHAGGLDGVKHQGLTHASGVAPAPERLDGVEIVADGARAERVERDQIALKGIDRLWGDLFHVELSEYGSEAAEMMAIVLFSLSTPIHEVGSEEFFDQLGHAAGCGDGARDAAMFAPTQPVHQSAWVLTLGIEECTLAGLFVPAEVVIAACPSHFPDAAGVQSEIGSALCHGGAMYTACAMWVVWPAWMVVWNGADAGAENAKRPVNTGLFVTPRPGLEPGTYRLTAGNQKMEGPIT